MASFWAYLQMYFEFYQNFHFWALLGPGERLKVGLTAKIKYFRAFCPELEVTGMVIFEYIWVYGFLLGISPDVF